MPHKTSVQQLLEFLTAYRSYIIFGVVIITGAWWFVFNSNGEHLEILTVKRAPFEAHISVSGKVVAAREVELGFSQSGRVAHVYATVGKKVSTGTLLAEVENGDLVATIMQKQATLDKLEEGTRSEEIAVKETALSNSELSLFETIRDAYRAGDDAVRQATDQYINNPRTTPTLNFSTTDAQLSIDIAQKRIALEDALTDWRLRIDGDASATTLAPLSKQHLITINNYLETHSVVLAHAITNTTVTSSTISGYAADVASAKNSITTALSALVKAESARASAEKDLALARAGSRSSDIAAARADVMSARAQLTKTRITAPFAGTITRVDLEQGEVAQAGTAVISMIGGSFQIESFVPEVNIAALVIGDEAKVLLDAYGTSVPFKATVIAIDPAETIREGISTYKTTLQFTTSDERIRSGMTADISIITERKPDAIVIPLGATTKRGDTTYLKIFENGVVSEREVETGLTSLGQVEIVSGLSEGESIVLNP